MAFCGADKFVEHGIISAELRIEFLVIGRIGDVNHADQIHHHTIGVRVTADRGFQHRRLVFFRIAYEIHQLLIRLLSSGGNLGSFGALLGMHRQEERWEQEQEVFHRAMIRRK